MTDAERQVMERTRQWASWVAPGYNGYDVEQQKDRLLDEAKSKGQFINSGLLIAKLNSINGNRNFCPTFGPLVPCGLVSESGGFPVCASMSVLLLPGNSCEVLVPEKLQNKSRSMEKFRRSNV